MKKSVFRQVLNEYLMVYNMKDAKQWIDKQPCGPEKKKIFLNECDMAFNFDGGHYVDYNKVQDYMDSLRRNPYVGLGI